MEMNTYHVDPEILAQVFMRLNGFFSLTNFIVHTERGNNYRVETDVDICGIRFPNRREIFYDPVQDYKRLEEVNLPLLVLGEVKKSLCSINESWLNPHSDTLKRIVATTGIFPLGTLDEVINQLRTYGRYRSPFYIAQIVSFGETRNPNLPLSDLIQVTWEEILNFIFSRFNRFQKEKSNNQQWDIIGQELWVLVRESNNVEEFRNSIILTGMRQIPSLNDQGLEEYLRKLQKTIPKNRPKNIDCLYTDYLTRSYGNKTSKEIFVQTLKENHLIIIKRGASLNYYF